MVLAAVYCICFYWFCVITVKLVFLGQIVFWNCIKIPFLAKPLVGLYGVTGCVLYLFLLVLCDHHGNGIFGSNDILELHKDFIFDYTGMDGVGNRHVIFIIYGHN